jgi:hypothetical protein
MTHSKYTIETLLTNIDNNNNIVESNIDIIKVYDNDNTTKIKSYHIKIGNQWSYIDEA